MRTDGGGIPSRVRLVRLGRTARAESRHALVLYVYSIYDDETRVRRDAVADVEAVAVAVAVADSSAAVEMRSTRDGFRAA